ncbi:MAG: nuclear transport factor 2 family protein [Sedimentisphaerales bacterium]|nr:nuclear transport factor 2 family protein [Sedimentisphaerales bacterium]
MTKVYKIILVLACVSIAWAVESDKSTIPVEQQQAIEKEVLKTHTQMAGANDSQDTEKFFSFILDFDKGLIIRDGRLFKTKQEAFDAVKKGFEGISKTERVYEQRYVAVISPETALFTANGTATITFSDGRILSVPFAVSMVYVLRDGQWKMLQGHYSVPNLR